MWWEPIIFQLTLSGPSQLGIYVGYTAEEGYRYWGEYGDAEWGYANQAHHWFDPMQTSTAIVFDPLSSPWFSHSVYVYSLCYWIEPDDSYCTPIPGSAGGDSNTGGH